MNLNDIITTIYIIVQLIIFTVLIITNLLNLMLRNKKNSYISIYYNSYAIEILDAISNKLYKIMKKISILFIVFAIAGLLSQPTIYNFIYSYISQNKEIFALVLGAFLASLFGFYSNKLSRSKENKINIARSSRILYEDLNRIHYLFEFHIIKPTEKYITYNKNWIENYSQVAKLLTSKHYTCISAIYEITENINILLAENNNTGVNMDTYNLKIKHESNTRHPYAKTIMYTFYSLIMLFLAWMFYRNLPEIYDKQSNNIILPILLVVVACGSLFMLIKEIIDIHNDLIPKNFVNRNVSHNMIKYKK